MSPRLVTLVTDFGTADGYVGEMKGTILRLAPGTEVIDITHEIPPGDVAAGAYTLGRAWRTFPAGSVHVAVVDPGVGTARRAIAVTSGGHAFVGPDNGLLTEVLGTGFAAVTLPIPADAAPTFHGRDVFAPAAAALVRGEPLASAGEALREPVRLPRPKLEQRGGRLIGTVVHVDRFGNLVTNIPGAKVRPGSVARVGAYDVPVRTTFGDVPSGDLVAFVGSGGMLEVAVRDGRADAMLGISRGAEVTAK